MSRFAEIFARARRQRRCALIAYLTAGDPSLAATVAIGAAIAEAGADIIELGVPFSDPVADGVVIQAASERALRRGVRLADVLEAAAQLRQRTQAGLLVFGYYNPVMQYGVERFARDAAAAGCDGALITDLIPEEAAEYRAAMDAAGLDPVFLAAPTSPDARLAAIAGASRGFVYAVSRTGVTGARTELAASAATLVARLRRVCALPVAVGFGISQPAQVAAVAEFADGAVVGTALVETIHAAPEAEAPRAAAAFIRRLAGTSKAGSEAGAD